MQNREFHHFVAAYTLLLVATPGQPWHPLHPHIGRAKPLLEGTRRERQMVPGRKRLAQLRVIYVVPKVLLCISYSLLPFTLLLSLH